MDPVQFFATSRLVIVAGKGGVGKTTVSATLASAAARVGLDTLVIDVEGSSGLPAMFGLDALGYDELTLVEADPSLGRGSIRARTLTADDALIEYLENHGLKRISKRLVSSGAVDVVATAAPGIKDILLLGKVKQLERSAQPDLIVLDAPAAGHAITFLQSARGLLDAVRVGPIHAQAREVLELLTDPTRCRVVLVTLPEETPVNELVETAYQLEDRVGVHLSPIVVNGEYPELEGIAADPEDAAREAGVKLGHDESEALGEAAAFRRHRHDLQHAQITRLSEQLPLPQLRLPFCFDGDLGPTELAQLADALLAGIAEVDPAALGVDEPGNAEATP